MMPLLNIIGCLLFQATAGAKTCARGAAYMSPLKRASFGGGRPHLKLGFFDPHESAPNSVTVGSADLHGSPAWPAHRHTQCNM